MALRDFDLKLLVALRALLEEANVTRAGERIQLGQSSMSTALAKLREQFGDELLVRIGRDYELTPLARELLPQVQRTLSEIENALSGTGPFDPLASVRTFRFMCSDFATVELRSILAPLLKEHPSISFEFRGLPAQPGDSERDLMTHDFIIAPPSMGIDGEHMELFMEHYVCLVARDNPALVDGAITWEAFSTLPHAVADFGKGHLTPPARRLRELGLHRVSAVKASGLMALPMIIAGSKMVAIVPSRLAERVGPVTGTVGVPLPFGEVELDEVLWWHPSHNSDPGHSWLREQVSAAIVELSGTTLP